LNIHSLANSFYLHELTRDIGRNLKKSRLQMQKLRSGNLIELPFAQRLSTYSPWSNAYVYQLTDAGKKWLDLPDAVVPTGHWLHKYMTSCVTASIDVMARRDCCRFIPAHEILEKQGSTLGLTIDGRKLIPDQLFAIDYGGRYRAFAVEVDRGTEPRTSTDARKSYESSILQYKKFLGKKLYQNHYGLNTNMLALFVFASEHDQEIFLELVKKHGAGKNFLTQSVPNFDTRYGRPYTPPKLFEHLWSDPWKTVDGNYYIGKI